ncbi:MAG: hypothetical protein N4A36_01050, partial [Candidatus Gracilibacteria bacterium]|nr:hypothetical protein [Candidatus Gracilibacteria bacterium]
MKNLKARGVFERAFYVFMTLSLLAFTVQIVSGATSVKQADVTATVLGTKPIVDNFDPTTAINNVSTAVTAIVGKNFTGATVVT